MKRVHLFIHSFVPHDAQSNHLKIIQGILKDEGLLGNTYASETRGMKSSEVRDYRQFLKDDIGPGDVALYQLGTGSKIAGMLADQAIPLVVNYHNITPVEMFEEWEPHVGAELELGRSQLEQLASRATLAMAVSRYNEQELIEVGYRATCVVPLFIEHELDEQQPDKRVSDDIQRRRDNGEKIWLFVGRISPNKCQHDVVSAFALYRQTINPNAHLYLVGSCASNAYQVALEQFINLVGLSENVTITGSVSNNQLKAYYATSDIFVCLSEHEGFCAPILEAFHNSLPVVAFSSSAVTETVGDAGLLLADKGAATVAAAADRILTDNALAAQVVQAGKNRLDDFAFENSRALFLREMGKVLS